jgi:hypothetical protein
MRRDLRGNRGLHLLAAAVVGLAGLALVPAGAATTARPLHFGKPVTLLDGRGRTEPSLVVDSAGRIFVSAIGGVPGRVGGDPRVASQAPGTPVWRSIDGGRTFSEHATCSAGPLPTNLSGGDSALVLDKRNYVYGTDLWLGDDAGWFSTDHGDTCIGTPTSHRPIDDRNWLAYSPVDDAIYQVYDGVDGLWVSRADLNTPAGPATSVFDAVNVEVAPENAAGQGSESPYIRAGVYPPGGIAADPRSGAVYATWPDQDGVAVARSTDKGLQWSIGHIPQTSVTGSASDDLWNFTPVAVDSRGTVYVAWAQVSGSAAKPNGISVWLGWSTDGGKYWHKQHLPGRRTAVYPTLAVYGPGKVAVGWVDAAATGDPNGGFFNGQQWRLEVAVVDRLLTGRPSMRLGTVDPNVHDNTLFVGPQGGDRGMGDFFSMAATPHGGLVVAYTRGEDGQHGTSETEQAMVSVLPPTR